ncbi:MAG: GIY-YIG nuclease family protein [Pseudomonadota bacterium]
MESCRIQFVIPAKAGTQLDSTMHADFQPTVYVLASKRNGTLYAGVTSNLLARIEQHRRGYVRGFTRNYSVKLLVWLEQHATMESAITREKRIKKWNRAWKLEPIEANNPTGAIWPKTSVFRLSLNKAGFPLSRE